MENDQNKEREELYERFRNSISQPLTERYFDEDELIDIFDTAGDAEDDLTRLEVLSVASRFFPDSEELNQRRCLLYGQLSPVAGAQYLEANGDKNSPLWQLMRLRQKRELPDTDMAKELDAFVRSVGKFEEEEVVIQLLRLVAETNMAEWLTKNLGLLKRRCSNQPLVLYEAAVAYETMHHHEEAAKVLVELTDIDPFGYSNWLMLAEQYIELGNEEEFVNAIDYALAINPDMWETRYVKGRYELYKENYEKAADLLGQCYDQAVAMPDVYRLYVFALRGKGDLAGAERVCRESLNLFPQEVLNIIPDLLLFTPADTPELLNLFFRNNIDNSEMFWRTWVERLWESGLKDTASAAAKCYYDNTGQIPLTLIPAEYALRRNGNPEGIFDWINSYLTGRSKNNEYVDLGMCCLMRMVVLARLSLFEEAIKIGTDYLQTEAPGTRESFLLRTAEIGTRVIIKNFIQKLQSAPIGSGFTDLASIGL